MKPKILDSIYRASFFDVVEKIQNILRAGEIATRNIKGWKGPCYLITDEHHDTFQGLMEDTPWEEYGRGNDPRCEHCMVHCGFELSATLGVNRRLGDSLKMMMWQLT